MAHGENHRIPPLTDRTWLVMYDAPSEYKNATAAATSSGVPIRRNGTIAADRLSFSGQAEGTVHGSVIGLADHPVAIFGTVNICIDQSGQSNDDPGFVMPVLMDIDPKTYVEVVPVSVG